MHRTTPLILGAAFVCLLASATHAIEPAELIDARLERQQVQFVNLGGGDLSFFNEQRQLRRVPADDFVSLRLTDRKWATTESATPPNSLALADGHILAGSFSGVQDGKIMWTTPAFGVVAVDLDTIARMAIAAPASPPQAAPAPGGASDRIILINGDLVTGFIESVAEAGLKLDANGQKLDMPWDRVARIELANPVNRGPGVWVRLGDGTQFKLDRAAFDGQKLTGAAMGRDIDMPGDRVQTIDFATRRQLIHLAEMTPRLVSGGEVFGVAMPPIADQRELALHAPLTLEYALPSGSIRFAADAALAEPDLDWADLTLVVTDGKTNLFRQRLNATTPDAALNVPLAGSTLTIQLEEGVNGPIRDRLKLSRAVILVETR